MKRIIMAIAIASVSCKTTETLSEGPSSELVEAEPTELTVEAFGHAWNENPRGDLAKLLSDELVWSDEGLETDFDKEGLLRDLEDTRHVIRELRLEMHATWSRAHYAVMRATLIGTIYGDEPELGLKNADERFSVPFLGIFRVHRNKIERAWVFWPRASALAQLGLAAWPVPRR